MKTLTLLIHAGSTLAMFGLIWFVQIVHYPLFSKVGKADFAAYEAAHASLTTLVVAPLMGLELLTGIMLLFYLPERWLTVAGLIMILLIWASTAFVQVPQHNILARGYDAVAHRILVVSNWARTLLWSARAVLVLFMLGVD